MLVVEFRIGKKIQHKLILYQEQQSKPRSVLQASPLFEQVAIITPA